MTGTMETHDVVSVGAGIAGSALATVLARAGLDVLLLEKSETFADRVRGEASDELRPATAAEVAPLDMSVFVPGVRPER